MNKIVIGSAALVGAVLLWRYLARAGVKESARAKRMMSGVEVLQPCEWSALQRRPNRLRVCTWNTLRKGYAFRGKFWVSDEHRAWEHRRPLVVQRLKEMNADILCLQETELHTLQEDFGGPLSELGYDYVHAEARTEDDLVKHGHTKPAIFYRRDMLALRWQHPRSRTVAAAFELRSSPGKLIVVINCHLQGGDEGGISRVQQMKSIFNKLSVYLQQQKLSPSQVALIVGGDFNCDHKEPAYRVCVEGDLSRSTWEQMIGQDKVDSCQFSHEFSLADACVGIKEHMYTFKAGTVPGFYLTIDHLLYSYGALKLEAVRDTLDTPQLQYLADGGGIPNEWHPSDHLPVAAEFTIDPVWLSQPLNPVNSTSSSSSSSSNLNSNNSMKTSGKDGGDIGDQEKKQSKKERRAERKREKETEKEGKEKGKEKEKAT